MSAGNRHDTNVGHVVPVSVLVGTLTALLVLTVITVRATDFNLGPLNIWIAMLIATTKAALVVLYFMHLRYDRPINAVVFIASLLFVALFITFALIDTAHYQEYVIPGYAPAMPESTP